MIILLQRRIRGRINDEQIVLPVAAYSEEQKVDKAKLKDLISLCINTLIPKVYHNLYRSLSSNDTFIEHSHNVRDDTLDELESD